MIQMLVPLWFVVSLRSGEKGALWLTVIVIAAMAVLQFPASLAAAVLTRFLPMRADLAPHELLRWLTWEWVVTGCLNYVIWVYAIPALSRRIEARWPFERIYFRRS